MRQYFETRTFQAKYKKNLINMKAIIQGEPLRFCIVKVLLIVNSKLLKLKLLSFFCCSRAFSQKIDQDISLSIMYNARAIEDFVSN